MAPARVAVVLCVPRDQCHPSTPLIRAIFPSPSLSRRAIARTATTTMAAVAPARSMRPLNAGRRGIQQWHVYGVGLHLRQQRRGNDCTPHSITQPSSSAHTPPEAREGCCGTLPFEWRASCVSRDQVHSNTQIIHWRFIYHHPLRLATTRTATTTTDGSMAAAAAAAARSTACAWCRM